MVASCALTTLCLTRSLSAPCVARFKRWLSMKITGILLHSLVAPQAQGKGEKGTRPIKLLTT